MLPSLIRTLTPLLAGWLLSHAPAWLGLTPTQASSTVALLLAGAYYVAVRAIEHYVPGASILLLSRVTPSYPPRPGRHAADDNHDAGSLSPEVVAGVVVAVLGLLLLGLLLVSVVALIGYAGQLVAPTALAPLMVGALG